MRVKRKGLFGFGIGGDMMTFTMRGLPGSGVPALLLLALLAAGLLLFEQGPLQAEAAGHRIRLDSYGAVLGIGNSGSASKAARGGRTAKTTRKKKAGSLPGKEQTVASSPLSKAAASDRKAPAGPPLIGPPSPLDPAWKELIERLVQDGFDRGEMREMFMRLGAGSYSPAYMATKISELYGVRGIGVKRASLIAPEIPEHYEQPVSDVTISACLEFIKNYAVELKDIEERHGVSAQTIIAILLVETGLGQDLGSDAALRALAAMAATSTPERLGGMGNAVQVRRVRPARLAATLKEKSDWAYKEVRALIAYGKQSGLDAAAIPGSVYGAVGICQFMPSNIPLYGVDGDKDGKIDMFSVVDAMYSVANYLEAHGWRGAKRSAQQLGVIRAYNHDNFYAARVLGISNFMGRAIAGKVPGWRSALAGAPSRYYGSGLRRGRRGPPIKGLGSYRSLIP